MTDRIQQSVSLPASPDRVYATLTDSKAFSEMSGGAPTEIDPVAGGAFSCFGGMIQGRNVDCQPGRRLVQAWRAKTWEEGVYSIVRFELTAEGNGTRLQLMHCGFPAGQADHLSGGWRANYWEPLGKYLDD